MKQLLIEQLIKMIQALAPNISIFYNDKRIPNNLTGITIGAFFSPSCQLFKGKAKEGENYVAITFSKSGYEADTRVEKVTYRNGRWHVNQGNRLVDYDEPFFDLMAHLPDGAGVVGITRKNRKKTPTKIHQAI